MRQPGGKNTHKRLKCEIINYKLSHKRSINFTSKRCCDILEEQDLNNGSLTLVKKSNSGGEIDLAQ